MSDQCKKPVEGDLVGVTVGGITPAIDNKEQEAYGGPFKSPTGDKSLEDDNHFDIRRDVKHSVTDNETLVHILKGNIGTGVLAMPEAFMHAGLWVGFAGIPIMGLICIHCMFILVKCSKELCKRAKRPSLSYEETAEVAFEYGPEPVRKYSKAVGYIITTFLIITQLGFCCVYFVFIPQNLKQALDCMLPSGTGLSQLGFMAIVILPLLLVCFVPDLKYLAPISTFASVVQATGLLITLYYMVRDLPSVQEEVPAFSSWSTLPLYFGTAVFAFEGIGLILPLENKMKTPQHLGGPIGVLNTGMVLVVCLYASVGFFGYLQYGNTVLGSITLNLPSSDGLAQAVKILMAVAIYLTYPLQMYVVYEIMKPVITRRFDGKFKIIAEYTGRTALVLLTFVLAAAIPNIGLFISLVGSVSGSTLALIFPPIIEIITLWPDTGKHNWRLIKGILICLFGFSGFITGAVTSVQAIVNFFVKGHEGPPFEC